jgi:hypothetical protein
MFRPPHPMQSIRIGYVKLFNAQGCTLSGRKEVHLRFKIEDVVVEAYVGPRSPRSTKLPYPFFRVFEEPGISLGSEIHRFSSTDLESLMLRRNRQFSIQPC